MEKFLSINDVTDLPKLLRQAASFKENHGRNKNHGLGRTVINIFFNSSMRTRISTEKAALNLGFQVITYDASGGWNIEFEDGVIMNADKAEHIREAAGVLSQYADIICVRAFPSLTDRKKDYSDYILNSFIRFATVPVVSMESAIRHPLQSLADCMTIAEYKVTQRPKVVLTWAPHPRPLAQAVANSFAEWMLGWDVADLIICNPEGFDLKTEFTQGATVVHDQREAFRNADFIYAKNWSSYESYGEISTCSDWMIDKDKMALTNQAYFMHCLPVRRNVVVSDEVLNSSRSLVLAQARNRVFAAQAVLQNMSI